VTTFEVGTQDGLVVLTVTVDADAGVSVVRLLLTADDARELSNCLGHGIRHLSAEVMTT
jgi:hypothetical protein